MDAAEFLFKKISQEQEQGKLVLPSLPELAIKIRDAVNADQQSAAQIARLVQLDPNIAARLVQIANSAAYVGTTPAGDCQQAIMRLGMKVTRDIVTCLITHNVFSSPNPAVKPYLTSLWRHSAHVAAISYVLAQVTPGLHPDKALLAGLVHDIGVLPVLHYAAKHNEQQFDSQLLDKVSVRLRAPLGRKILEAWQFDESLLDVPEQAENWLRDHGEDIDYSDLVIVAQLLSFQGTSCEAKVPGLGDVPAFNKLTIARLGPDASIQVLEEAREDINRVMSWLKN